MNQERNNQTMALLHARNVQKVHFPCLQPQHVLSVKRERLHLLMDQQLVFRVILVLQLHLMVPLLLLLVVYVNQIITKMNLLALLARDMLLVMKVQQNLMIVNVYLDLFTVMQSRNADLALLEGSAAPTDFCVRVRALALEAHEVIIRRAGGRRKPLDETLDEVCLGQHSIERGWFFLEAALLSGHRLRRGMPRC